MGKILNETRVAIFSSLAKCQENIQDIKLQLGEYSVDDIEATSLVEQTNEIEKRVQKLAKDVLP